MAEDNLKKVWQTLYDDDYDVPDYDTFKADMEDDNNLHDLWEVVGQKYDVPEYEQFRSDMGFGAVAEAPQMTGTVVDQTMEDINRATGHMPQEVQDMAFSGQPQMNGQSLAEKNNPQMFQQPAVDPEPWKAEGLTKEEYEDIAWMRQVNAPTRQAVDEQGRIRENAAPGQGVAPEQNTGNRTYQVKESWGDELSREPSRYGELRAGWRRGARFKQLGMDGLYLSGYVGQTNPDAAAQAEGMSDTELIATHNRLSSQINKNYVGGISGFARTPEGQQIGSQLEAIEKELHARDLGFAHASEMSGKRGEVDYRSWTSDPEVATEVNRLSQLGNRDAEIADLYLQGMSSGDMSAAKRAMLASAALYARENNVDMDTAYAKVEGDAFNAVMRDRLASEMGAIYNEEKSAQEARQVEATKGIDPGANPGSAVYFELQSRRAGNERETLNTMTRRAINESPTAKMYYNMQMRSYIRQGLDPVHAKAAAMNDLRNLFRDREVERMSPTGDWGYVGGSAFYNNMPAELFRGLTNFTTGDYEYDQILDEAYARYGQEKASTMAKVGASVAPFVVDMALGSFKVPGLVAKIGQQTISKGLLYGARWSLGVADDVILRRMGGNILYRTLMGGLGGGLNFMTYNAMSAAVRGFKDNNFSWNTVVEEGGHGFADGIVFGGVNGLAGKLTDVAKGAWAIPAELGVLAVEGGTFTALDYMRTGELTPESVGTSFGMAIAGRMTHFGQWASDVAARVNGTKWKNTVTGPVRLSKETRDELQDRYPEICRLMSDGELAKAMVKGARGKVTSQDAMDTGVAIDKEWEAMQNDSSVPFEVRRMVNYALNGQVTPKPVTCNYRISSVGDATYGETLDINGNVIDRYKLESEKDRVNFEQGVALEAERNRIGLEQNAYVAQEYYPHLEDAVEAVAAEYGMDPNELLDNYYKKDIKGKAMRKAVDKVEQLYLAEIEGKTDIVSAVNDKYGVDIEEALKVPIHERTEAEHNAIEEYEQRLTGRYDEAQDKSTAELVAEDMEQSRNDGFEAQGDERADIKERLEDAANALTEMRIDPRQFDSMDENAISDWLESRGNNAEETEAVLEYLDARSAFEGIRDRVQDEAGKRIEEAAKETDDRTNNDTGMIHPVVMGDDREAFVVSGRVEVKADGTIDLEKSDRDIFVRYPDEEQPVMTTADKIKSGEPTIDPETAKQETADGIMQEVAGEAVSQMNRDLAFNEGDTFTVLVDDKPVELTVVGTDRNTGNPILQDSDGRRAPAYPDIVQQMHDEWREWVKNGGDRQQQESPVVEQPTQSAGQRDNAAPVEERPAEEQAAGPDIMPAPGQGDPQEMLNYFRARGMSDRVADKTITNNIVAAHERLVKAERELNESKETDPQKLVELENAVDMAQRELYYWNAVARLKNGGGETAAQQRPTEQAGEEPLQSTGTVNQIVEEPAREEYQGDGMSDEMRERMDDGTGIVGIVDNIARQLGLKVRDWDGPEGIPGYIDPDNGVIYINRNRVEGTRDTYRFTLGHELTHGLKKLAEDMGRPELYEALKGAALSAVRVREGSGYDKFVSDLMNRYRSAHYMDAYGEAIAAGRSKAEAIEAGRAEADRVTQDFIEEEIVCDTVGELLSGDEARARELLEQVEDKSVMQRIKDYFTELLTKVRDAFGKGSKEYDDLDGVINRFNQMYNEVLKQREEMIERESGEDHVKFSLVEDQNEVKRLEEEPKMEGYRNVSLQSDGSLRSPMANRLGKKGEKSRPTQGFFLGQWEKADENPDLATDDGKINLKKPGGLGSVDNVDYNPYIHIRPTLVNKQFKNAWERDDLVYVKTQYPASEEAQGYHAEKAALPVGRHPWNGGELILSRWDKPVEIVPWERVADDWEAEFKDRGVEFDIVPPKLLPILAERGVEILPPHAGMGKRCNDAYEAWKSEHPDGPGVGKSIDSVVAEAEQMTETNPTDGQKESGNYRKGHVKVDGFDISIEQPKGSVRSGVDASGKPWSQEMHNTYGYIRGTEGVDGDHIDVFLSDHLDGWNGNVYVVDQVNKDGSFDEHKVMYGFDSEQEARDAYLSNYKEGWTGLGNITGVSREEFKKWVDSSHRKTKPFAEYKSVRATGSQYTDNTSRPIQGLEGYTEEEILEDVRAFIEQQLEDAGIEGVAIKGMALHGSRMRGDARPDSDLDVVVEYEGDISEDAFFNLVNYDLNFRGPNGVIIDINPITRGKSGTLEQYMERSRRYDEEKRAAATETTRPAQSSDTGDRARFSISERTDEAGNEVYTETREDGTKDREVVTMPDGSRDVTWFDEAGRKKEVLSYYPNGEVRQVNNYDSEGDLTRLIQYDENRRAVRHWEPRIGTDWERDENGVARGMSNGVEVRPYGERFSLSEEDREAQTHSENFKRWFGDWENDPDEASKVVDSDGRPKVVLHGTPNNEFYAFDPEKTGSNTDQGWLGTGFYFYGNAPEYASQYAGKNGRVVQVYLDIKNPYIASVDEFNRLAEANDPEMSRRFREQLEDEGYDGVYYNGDLNEEWVAFRPEQIKSATENNGEFDPNNPDIRFSLDEGTQKIFDTAKRKFGETKDIREAGYVLPDGSMLDFSGRHELDPGTDSSFLAGRRATDHRAINQISFIYDENGDEVDTGVSSDMPDFIKRGAIRIDNNAGSINLSAAPTMAQRRVLRELIRRNGGDVQVDFGDGWDSDHYVEYEEASAQRVLGDIDRYFDEGIKPEGNVRYSIADTFYSNAARAVEGVKQEKAKAEQWKAMLTKAGGIKAGEDKWMGLSQWLDEHKGETLTKGEVLEFVRQNGVQMEEVGYSEAPDTFESLKREYDQWLHDEGFDYAQEQLRERFGDDADIAFDDLGGELVVANEEAAAAVLGSENIINSTRLEYTTEGLENKREIAFVVPGIEPYQENDEIHFGPENQGRAVMWVRFGETTDTDGKRVLVIDEIQSNRHQDAREKGYEDPALTERLKQIQQEIDAATKEFGDFNDTLRQKYGVSTNYTKIEKTREEWGWNHRLVPNEDVLTKEEVQKWKEGDEKIKALRDVKDKLLVDRMWQEGVPAAPFEKNWHEVAMKRMLRLAAEGGFDKVAWTTGMQQAERYDIGKHVDKIEVHDLYDGLHEVQGFKDGKEVFSQQTENGEQGLAELLGKDMARKAYSNLHEGETDYTDENGRVGFSGENLQIGGEGMKGFYDQMLPRFMDKYGKRWGVKTGEVTLATPGGETMHSVDVTPEMRRSVLEQGQPLFSLSEEIENYRPEQVSWERTMLDRLLQNAANNAERNDMRKQATREVNRTLRGLFDRLSAPGADAGNLGFDISRATQAAARAQRGYDRWTVDELVSMAKSMLKSGMYKELRPYEVQRLVNMINQGVGRREIQDQMNTVFDVLMKANLRGWSAQLKKLMSTKPYNINSQTGVRTIGQVDGLGGRILTAMRRGLEMTGDELMQRIAEVSDRIDSDDTASHELEGLMLAQQYNDLVGKYDADNKNIKDLIREQQEKVYDFYQVPVLDEDGNPKFHQRTGEQLFETRKRLKPEFGGLDADGNRQPVSEENKALRQRVEATVAGLENSMRENWVRMSEGYDRITDDLGGNVAAAVTRAKEFRDNEKLRKQQIYHAANSDLLGVEDNTETVDPSQQMSPANWSFVRGLLGPLATFEKMMRFFGRRNAGGEGRLFNMFVRRQIDCGDREWRDKKAGMDEMDNKSRELFGKKWMTMGNEMRDGNKFPFITLSYFDKTGKPRTIDLRQDEAVYLYCVNKMRDGQMKLNAMGIDGDMVEQIVQRLDKNLVKLADWYQGEFLPKMRNRYNETYERMFGTPMAHIDNYIHLNINKNETASNQEIGQPIGDQRGPTYVTGSLKERKTNVTPIELRTSIFDLAWSEHDKMEHWNAWGEFSRDMKDLINYRNFKAKVRNMKSVEFGNGKELLDNFSRCAAIVTGDYDNPGRHAKIDRAATNLAKGVTSAKIGFRAFTALKQTLSFPAFFSDARPDDLLFAMGNAEGTIKWAMENLPGFSKRWQSRQAGDTRLMETDSDWKVWKYKWVKKIGTASMLPNASVDCLTVAIGARGVYRTAKRRYLDYGFSEAQAEQRALQDAAISYNASQQSSEGAFTSAQQVDRTLAGVATTVFRNASMGYERRFTQGLRNLKNMAKRGYREEVIENTKKQMMEEGLTEEQAERAAERVYNRMKWHSMADVVNFGFVLPFFWNLGPAMVYILGGEDDEQKQELVRDSALHALYGPIEGLSMGGTISELANIITGSMLMDEKSFKETMQGLRHRNFNPLPIVSDMQSVFNSFATDTWSGVNDVFNIVVQMGVGVNPETVTNMTWGIIDACQGDMDLARKTAFAFLRFINAPAGQVEKLYMDELGITKDEASRMSWDELAKKYARYHAVKDATVIAPFLSDEAEAAREERYVDRFYDRAQEKLEKAEDDDLQRVYGKGDEAKKIVAKAKAKQAGLEGERFSKKPSANTKESTKKAYDTYSIKRSYGDMAEDVLLQQALDGAKADGDDEKAEKIQKVLDSIAAKVRGEAATTNKPAVKGMGVDKETDERILKEVKEIRKKAMKELGITR